MGRASNRKKDPAHRAKMNRKRLARVKRSVRSRKTSERAAENERLVDEARRGRDI